MDCERSEMTEARSSPEAAPKSLPASAPSKRRREIAHSSLEGVWGALLIAVATVSLATWAIRETLALTGGIPAAPLDDAYIHFQYARSFAESHPFVYSPGAAPAPGASSLLWAAVLAVFYAIGFKAAAIVWPAWILGWGFLGMLAWEVLNTTRPFLNRPTNWLAAASVLSCGGLAWSAGSAMAVIPLAWLLFRVARRSAEWMEIPGALASGPRRKPIVELLLLALAGPLVRPEGVLATIMVAGVLSIRPAPRVRWLGPSVLLFATIPPLINWSFTGQAASTTLAAKWLFARPYPGEVPSRILEHLKLLLTVLVRGEQWAKFLAPEASPVWAWLALPALIWRGFQKRCPWRTLLLGLVGLGILLPLTYHSFLWNRLRYLWPFVPVWLVGVVAVGDLAADYAAKLWSPLGRYGFVVALLVVYGGWRGLPDSIADLAKSSDAIRRQQVSLGEWARAELPAGSVIGVNDAGAIAYFSGHTIFDLVGLTTPGEAWYWSAGAGSRFEHYEDLGAERLPTHLVVYPHWWQLTELSGELLTQRTVYATILGGYTMEARRVDYRLLGSASVPDGNMHGRPLIDELDVAHLEQEQSHRYELFDATQQGNRLIVVGDRADGARVARLRETFVMNLQPEGILVARIGTEHDLTLSVRMGKLARRTFAISAGRWQELSFGVPESLSQGPTDVEIDSDRPFMSMHFWAFGPARTIRPTRSESARNH